MATTNPDNALLRQYVELQQRWESQQQPQQQATGTGLLGGAIGGMFANGTNLAQQYDPTTTVVDYPQYLQPMSYSGGFDASLSKRTIKFNRINEVVEIAEGRKVSEPLDELRIKVAKWLN